MTKCNKCNSQPELKQKLIISAYAALLFLIIASPAMYGATSSILGDWVAKRGAPTATGLLLHTAVYTAAVFGLMYVPLPFVKN
jgi:hypothetical protein